LNNPCKLLEKIFDSLVTPILLYCSEVWGVYLDPGDSSIVEKLNFIQENEIFVHKGNLPSSARHATFDTLQ
jgi:hypothetical protein